MRQKVLIVDDDPVNLRVLEHMLEPMGCDLVRATDGDEALEAVATESPDLVILDRRMPRVDGIEVLRQLRASPLSVWVPVILVTAESDRVSRLQGFEAGADEFIEKPIDRPLLQARVRTLLRLRAANAELVKRARDLERLHRARRDLVDFVVHDLKNPLSVISVNLDFVRGSANDLSIADRESLRDASYAAQRMHGLLLDLLSVERIEQAQLPLRPVPVDLAAMAREVVSVHRTEAGLRGISLTVAPGDGTCLADADLIRRVLENLVENALHHTDRDGRILVRLEPDTGLGVVVANTGHPIDPGLRDRLFEKFVRGDGDRKARHGLGLYFSRLVATAHGGSLSLIDDPAWPVAFRLFLPSAAPGARSAA